MNKRGARELTLRLIGLVFCTVPVAAATLSYFPLWASRGAEAVLSGLALILILASLLPVFRAFRRLLRSPAVYTLWLIAFLLFFALSRIAEDLTVICFVGFVGNLIGAVFFKIARRRGGGDGSEG